MAPGRRHCLVRLEALMVLRSRAYLTSGGGKPPGGALFLLSGLSPALLCAVFSQARGHPGWLPSSQAALTPRKGAEPQLLPGGPKQSAASPSKLPTCGQRQGRGWGSLRWKFRVQRVWIWGSQGTLSWSSCLCPHILVCSEEPLGQVHSL